MSNETGLVACHYTTTPMVDTRMVPLWGYRETLDHGKSVVLVLPGQDENMRLRQIRLTVKVVNSPQPVVTADLMPTPTGQSMRQKIERWGLSRLGVDVYLLVPNVTVPGVLQAFIALCGVPNPAPWGEDAKVLRVN